MSAALDDAPFGLTPAAIDDDMQARKRRRKGLAESARTFRKVIRDAAAAGNPLYTSADLNDKIRIIIGSAPPRVSRLAIRKEIIERLSLLSLARERDVSHMACGDDDAWFERLEYESAYIRALAAWWVQTYEPWLAKHYPDTFFLSSHEHERAGMRVCPGCLGYGTHNVGHPEVRDPWTVIVTRKCLDCDNEYTFTLRAPHPADL